jgi:hypothetical protein
MADYYPLIKRAIAGLDPSAPGESRRALYERARSALIAQLRGLDPPLTESEITRERLSLEEAVRKVEAEAAQLAREASRELRRGAEATRTSNLGRTNPRPAVDPAAPGAAARNRPATPAPSIPRSERQPPPGSIEPRPPQRNLRIDPPPIPRQPQPGAGMPDPDVSAVLGRRPDSNEKPAAPKTPIKGFSDVTADVDDLGSAAARIARRARRLPMSRRRRRNSIAKNRRWKIAAQIIRRHHVLGAKHFQVAKPPNHVLCVAVVRFRSSSSRSSALHCC